MAHPMDSDSKRIEAGSVAALLSLVDQGELISPERQREEEDGEVLFELAREVVESLERGEGVTYKLEGRKIKDRGRYKQPEIKTSWHKKDAPEIEDSPSKPSELTVIPSQLYIPGSNRRTLEDQLSMLGQFNEILGNLVPGLRATIPPAPDMVELIDAHFSASGEALFSGIFEDEDTARLYPARFRTDTVLATGENAPEGGRYPVGVAMLVRRIGVDREIEIQRQAPSAAPFDLFVPLVFEFTQAQVLPQAA